MDRYKIVCSLDGQEPESKLYGEEYAKLRRRMFSQNRHARGIEYYFIQRARGMRWEVEPPAYHIVLVDE